MLRPLCFWSEAQLRDEHIMRCALEEHNDGITIGRRIKTNLRFSDDISLPRTSKDNRISERFVDLGSLVNFGQ